MNEQSHPGMTINLGGGEHDQPTIEVNGIKIIVPGPWQFKLAVAIVIFILSIYSFIWITEDAQKRGKSGCLAFLFIFAAGWPFSILWWLWLRPKLQVPPPVPLAPSPAPAPPPLPENR